MSQYSATEGDNIEFVAPDIGDYIIWLGMSGTDTATTKYATNPRSAVKFEIRVNSAWSLVSENNTIFTNPVTMIANSSYVEKRNIPAIVKLVIRTTAVNAQVKVRWF